MVDDQSTADGPAADRNIEEAGLLLRFFVFRFQAIERAMPQKPPAFFLKLLQAKKKPAGVTRRA